MTKLTLMGAVSQETNGFTIIFLDAGGLASCGDTLDEALAMGKEALETYVEVLVDDGDPLPLPSNHTVADVENWLWEGEGDEGDRGSWLGLFPIEVDVPERGATVRLRVKADLVDRIAELGRVTARQIDPARFIEEAVEHEIEHHRKSAA
jgi:predicted RNase H-like HicB family nuclease